MINFKRAIIAVCWYCVALMMIWAKADEGNLAELVFFGLVMIEAGATLRYIVGHVTELILVDQFNVDYEDGEQDDEGV